MPTKDKRNNTIKDNLKISIGAPLAAIGGWAAYRGAPILRNKLTKVTDGDYVSNYLKFSENMLGKSFAGKKAIKHHRNILKGKPEASSKIEKVFANILINPKSGNFMSKHYSNFAKKPKDALDFWKWELKQNKLHRVSKGKTDQKTLIRQAKKEKNFNKDMKAFDKEMSKAPDVHTGLKNIKSSGGKKILKLLRAEKRQPGDVIYPSMVGGVAGLGVVGAGLTADGIRKKASKESKKPSLKEEIKDTIKNNKKDVVAPAAASAALAATPALRDTYLKGYEAKIDPKSKKLVIVTEGGKHNPGGGGHAAAAKSISEQYDKLHGKGSSKVINFTDYSRFKNDPLSKFNKARYDGMVDPSASKFKRGANMLGYMLGFGPMRNTDKKKFQKDLKGAGRVIVTQPDAVNFVRPMGIAPEVAVTDYGIGKGNAKDFWEMSYGLGGKKDSKAITKAFTPSEEAKKVFSQRGTPTKSVPSVPISDKFMSKSKGKKLKHIDLADNKGNPTGEKIKIDRKKKLVVVTGGSTGLDVDSISNQLAESGRKDLQIVGISGKSDEIRKNIGKGAIAQGYEKNFDKLLDSADIVVSRPHGISTTEALSKGKPVIPVTTHRGKDSYAPHMVGNADQFSKMQKGSPVAAINEEGSISKAINEVADNLRKHKSKAKKTSKEIKNNAAKIIASEASSTKNYAYKMPAHLKAPLYASSAAAGLIAMGNQIKKMKERDSK